MNYLYKFSHYKINNQWLKKSLIVSEHLIAIVEDLSPFIRAYTEYCTDVYSFRLNGSKVLFGSIGHSLT